MKKYFELESAVGSNIKPCGNRICIVGKAPKDKPYVVIEIKGVQYHFIQDKDLEMLAVNILKALKSKRLSTPTTKQH